MTTIPATTRTAAEVDAILTERHAAGLHALDLFAQHYPAAVVRELRDSVLELLHKGQISGVETAALLSVLNDFLDLCAADTFQMERAAQLVTADCMADELHASVGRVLGLLLEHGYLCAWC